MFSKSWLIVISWFSFVSVKEILLKARAPYFIYQLNLYSPCQSITVSFEFVQLTNNNGDIYTDNNKAIKWSVRSFGRSRSSTFSTVALASALSGTFSAVSGTLSAVSGTLSAMWPRSSTFTELVNFLHDSAISFPLTTTTGVSHLKKAIDQILSENIIICFNNKFQIWSKFCRQITIS